MCLTIPAKVIAKNGCEATVLGYNNEAKNINLSLLPDIEVGDWILHTVGQVIKKIDAQEAQEIINLLAYSPKFEFEQTSPNFQAILQKAKIGRAHV